MLITKNPLETANKPSSKSPQTLKKLSINPQKTLKNYKKTFKKHKKKL
jgi:hypothetical protein